MPITCYVGIKGIIMQDNKVLVLKCKDILRNRLYWDLPGGRMEDGETIVDALQRELHEELPVIKNIQIHNLIAASKLPHKVADGQGLVLLIYKVTADLPSVVLSNEHIGYKWVNRDEITLLSNEAELSGEFQKILQQSLE